MTLNGTGAFTGNIQDGSTAHVALTLAGGTLTLSGASTYSGQTSVNGGSLTLANNTAAGASSIVVSSTTGGGGVTGTQVAVQGGITVSNSLSLPSNITGDIRSNLFANSGNNTWSGPITLNGSGRIAFAGNSSASLNLTGGISGPSFTGSLFAARGATTFTTTISSTVNLPSVNELAIADGAKLIVSSTGNTVATVDVVYGTLQIGASNALPTGVNLVLGESDSAGLVGAFDLAGFNQQVGRPEAWQRGQRLPMSSSATAARPRTQR